MKQAELWENGSGDHQKEVFRRIRNYLAGRLVGTTRDAALMHEVVKCLFCRVKLNGTAPIPLTATSDDFEVAKIYRRTFCNLRQDLPAIFESSEEILMDPASIAFVNQQLSTINLYDPSRDPLGDLYEAFVGTSIQKNEGQFFTPQNAIAWLVKALAPRAGERIIDPACGAGGFLSYTARYLKEAKVTPTAIAKSLYGIEKDKYLAKLANAHVALTTLAKSQITCGDSLAWVDSENRQLPNDLMGSFDVVLTNPPFGSRIVSASDDVRFTFQLAKKWGRDAKTGIWMCTSELQNNSPPQVLFIERCLSLLKRGGRLGIVVPESLISSAGHGYVVQFLKQNADLRAVVGMPESLFKTSGKGGTHTKTCLLIAEKKAAANENRSAKAPLFMAEAKWCGNDSRGKNIEKDDLPEFLASFRAGPNGHRKTGTGYWITHPSETNNLAPRYHDPETQAELTNLRKTHDLVRVGDLVANGVLTFSTGDEVGKMCYGTGSIPFVRTSDISNWEIKIEPKQGVSEDVYLRYKERQDVRAGDILMVRDGTYLIGNCAFISEYDTRIVYQSHIYKIRVNDPAKLSPYLLLALLSSDPVAKQIRAKRVTQDIIDSLGDRVNEIYLPIPKNSVVRAKITQMVESCIRDRIEARELAREARHSVIALTAEERRASYKSKPINALPRKPRTGKRRSKGAQTGLSRRRSPG